MPTPALLVDLAAAERNIARMATALKDMPAEIRPHIKVHKSVELATRQVAAGAIGLSVATVWEAVALAWAGLDNLFVVNTVSHPEKIRVLAELARTIDVLVAVDELANAAALSAAAGAAGSQLGVMIEVDTGMDRAGVDAEEDAVTLAKEISALENLRLEGITGYEGHCSLEFDEQFWSSSSGPRWTCSSQSPTAWSPWASPARSDRREAPSAGSSPPHAQVSPRSRPEPMS